MTDSEIVKTDPPEKSEEALAFELARLLEKRTRLGKLVPDTEDEMMDLLIEYDFVGTMILEITEELTIIAAHKLKKPP